MSVVYLYGFTPPATRLPERGLLGVGDAPVELVALDGFSAVIGRVDEATYAGPALEARSTEMEWMAEQGLRHEQVVAWFVDHALIVPSRLLTLFSTMEGLRAAAAAEAETIRHRLERFDGLREWDLKVDYDPALLGDQLGRLSEEIGALDAGIAAATPGKRFLLERKRRDLVRSESRAVARRVARELLDRLRDDAADVVIMPPPTDAAPVVLNAALLLDRAREAAVAARAREEAGRLAELGVGVRLTGPWAPYRFMGDDDG